jgi:hypothetical protein
VCEYKKVSLGEAENERKGCGVARYGHDSSTWLNGFALAKVVHINQ